MDNLENYLVIIGLFAVGGAYVLLKKGAQQPTLPSPHEPKNDTLQAPPPAPKSKCHLELRMLVESTYLGPLDTLSSHPDEPLNDEQLEAVFKRPNIHKLHARNGKGSTGERSFVYDNGESFFAKASQLYLCVNIELMCDEGAYQELINTKSLSVMKRRLKGAIFTLRELRYEKLNDTARVTSGNDA